MQIKSLVFFSNYYNHHQKALCDEWYKLLGEGFTFVETEPIEGFRATMGWGKEEVPSYVLRTYVNAESKNRAMRLAVESDLVVMGTAPEEFIEKRLELNKLIFRYSERPLKEGFIKFFIPRLTKKYIHLHVRNRKKKIYVLAASAYTTWDYNRMFRSYPSKCYKFGYFPKHIEYDIDMLLQNKKTEADKLYGDASMPTILWTGRMLRLKHPELLIKAAKKLKDKGLDFRIVMIGEGKQRKHVEVLTRLYGLQNRVTFMNFLSPSEAREKMSRAKIFVMTSDFLEGWGSVIYEALNAGCATVVSHAPGATPWLVKNHVTGLIFKNKSVASLTDKLEMLICNPDLIDKYGKAAYNQMHEQWNPQIAARNVLKLADELGDGKTPSIKDGPCSKAKTLKNNWFRE